MNKLEKIYDEAIKDPAKRVEFYNTILEEKVCALVPIDSADDIKDGKYVKDNKVSLVTLKNENGVEFFPIFTSVEEIRRSFPDFNVGYVEGPGRWFFNLVRGKNVILNPYSKTPKPFVPQEIEDMITGKFLKVNKYKINTDKQVLIGAPKVYPEKLVEALSKYFEGKEDVRSAFIVEYTNGETKPHSLVIVDTTGEMEPLVREASQVIKGTLLEGDFVEFMQLDISSSIGMHVLNNSKAFFSRI